MKLIVDASVAIKWFIPENLFVEARRLLVSKPTVIVPSFMLTELSNILWKKVLRSEISKEESLRIFNICKSGLVTFIPTTPLMDVSFDMALELKHPVYDCIYLAAAELNLCQLVTADKEFFTKVNKSHWQSKIQWLEMPL